MPGHRHDRGREGATRPDFATNPDDFEAFYREHIEAVTRFVARRVSDPYLVADLTADVFVAAIGSAARYDPQKGDAASWLFGIARHVVAAEQRRLVRERSATRTLLGRALVDSEDLIALHARIDAESSARTLYRAMAALSDADRAVLELVALDGLKVRDAAIALDIAPVTARVRLHRARRRLQGRLADSHIDYELKEVPQ